MLKPVAHRATDALDRIAGGGPLARIFVRDRGQFLPIAVADIECLEADDDYVAVYSRGRHHFVYPGMNDFEARFDPERFLRIHRSHIVNLDVVAPFAPTRLQVEMKDGEKLVASRRRPRELRGLAI